MSFYSRYELMELIREDGIKSFRAKERASGRTIAVHILPGTRTPEYDSLLNRVRNLPPERAKDLFDIGEHEGTPYIATAEWVGAHGVRAWIAGDAAENPPLTDKFGRAGTWRIPTAEFRGKSDSAPALPNTGEVGDFTKLFKTPPRTQQFKDPRVITNTRVASGANPPVPGPIPEPPAPHPVPEEPQPPAPPSSISEEFERMFGAVQQPSGTGQFGAPAGPQTPANDSQGAGEFTRMFQVQKPDPVAPPQEKSAEPADKQPGEFTRFFEAQKRARARNAPAAPAAQPSGKPAPAPAPSAKDEGPGEFTRMFQVPSGEAPPAPAQASGGFQAPAAQPEPAASFTGLFTKPEEMRTETMEVPVQQPERPPHSLADEPTRMFQTSDLSLPKANPPSAKQAAEPGDFTRMFQTPSSGATAESKIPEPAKQAPSDFTRAFQSPVMGGKPAASPPTGLFVGSTQPQASTPLPTPQQGPGDFTRMFQTLPSGATAESKTPEPARQAPVDFTPATPPPPPPRQSEGDFTRMFQAPSSEPPAAAPQSSAAGDFTRAFQAPPAQPPRTTENPHQAFTHSSQPQEPGEFTRFFQAPPPKTAPEHHPALRDPNARPIHSPESGLGSRPGEFTGMFGTPSQSAPIYPTGGATGSFQAQPFPPASQYGSPQPAQPPQQVGPSDFTRIFDAQAAPAPVLGAPPARPAAQSASAGKKAAAKPNYMPLLIIFGVLFILIVALVVFFAVKK